MADLIKLAKVTVVDMPAVLDSNTLYLINNNGSLEIKVSDQLGQSLLAQSLGAYTAAELAFTPSGTLVATQVQAAIEELDNSKADLSGGKLVSTQLPTIDKTYVGLSNVDNTADASKPVSTAQAAAIALKANSTDVTTALSTKADLVSGKILTTQLPDAILGQLEFISNWDFANALPTASSANKGNFYIASNATVQNGYIMGDWAVSIGTEWVKIDNTDAVVSVAGLMGTITVSQLLTALGLSTIVADVATKADATATAASLATKAPIGSIPTSTKSTAYTLVSADKGTRINTTAGVTVPAGVMAAGDVVLVRNTSGAAITLTCSAVTAYLDGSTTAKTSMTIAAGSIAGIQFDTASSIFVSGKGVA